MRYESDIDDPAASFRPALAQFGLDSPSPKASSVGAHCVKIAANNIHDRGIAFEGPDGRWPDNAESTIRKKGFNAPNFETGAMLSHEQLEGTLVVSRTEADATYGIDEECKKKAHFAHTGQSILRILRPFYGFTASDADEIAEGVMDDLVNFLMTP